MKKHSDNRISAVKLASAALIGSFLVSACGPALSGLMPDSAGDKTIATPNSAATATATPFAPVEATPMPEVTAGPSPTPIPTVDPSQPWGGFDAPIQASAIEIPPPAEPIQFDEDVVNILILGSDARPYEGGYRTDAIMVVSLDPSEGTATLFSIPRDLYVFIPGWRMDRINVADPRGDFELVEQTILYNFGIPIHYAARMNFWGFTNLVDSLGGLTVEVTGHLYDECGGIWWRYAPGTYTMDGFQALCYVRMRKASSDFDRLRRQQEVLQALFRKVISLQGLTRLPELYGQFKDLVQTDIDLPAAIRLTPLASHLANNRDDIQLMTVGTDLATSWRVPYSGAAVLLPDRPAIDAMLRDQFGS
ncbi:MAG: LCP family protein [Anaerolineales bacterium]